MTLNKKHYYNRLPDVTGNGIYTGASHHPSRLESEQTESVASNLGPGPYPSQGYNIPPETMVHQRKIDPFVQNYYNIT